jgi:hypothetical protein
MQQSRASTAEIEYPESDGKPMAETDVHRDWTITTLNGSSDITVNVR